MARQRQTPQGLADEDQPVTRPTSQAATAQNGAPEHQEGPSHRAEVSQHREVSGTMAICRTVCGWEN